MRNALDKGLRSKLEKTVIAAREIAETAVTEVLSRLGVGDATAPDFLDESQRKLRNQLRAHGRQLGDRLDDNSSQQTTHLVAEMAYEHWHRMLFARFLEQNNLLMYDAYTSVTLDDCAELAEEEPDCANAWELAGRLAAKMLPQIFRVDSPVFSVKLAINHVKTLEAMLAELDPETFQAQDSLGWCYQFWQSKRKDEVNKSGDLIGADELSPVTQLFTEPYMVSFLLDNSLGAWWAKRRLTQDQLHGASNEQELREYAAIDGVSLSYLRFVKAEHEQTEMWQPAGGWFDGWPEHIKDLKTLDPCCGSGHFLVALFLMLVPMRMQLEQLDSKSAIDKVLQENLHGLELDGRCIEIAAFALALEAWRYPNAGGYRTLPKFQLACSGQDVLTAGLEWQQLIKQNSELKPALEWLQQQFKNAPVLGSLIDIKRAYYEGKEVGKLAPWQQLLAAQAQSDDDSRDAQITAQGLAMAAQILAGSYHLVATNVPYLGRGKHCYELQTFCDNYYPEAKADLATVFLERCLDFNVQGGSSTIVLPQNWLFLTSYKKFREKLLNEQTWNLLARLGEKGFESAAAAGAFVALITLSKGVASKDALLRGLDVADWKTANDKKNALLHFGLDQIRQDIQLSNPDSRVSFTAKSHGEYISKIAECYQGLVTGDIERFTKKMWELLNGNQDWLPFRRSNNTSELYGDVSEIIFWGRGVGALHNYAEQSRAQLHDMHESGNKAWGRKGVAINRMRGLNSTPYYGEHFDNNVAVIYPQDERDLLKLMVFVRSSVFPNAVRELDQALKVTNQTLLKVSMDTPHWESIAKLEFPRGFPKPHTNDFTQWIFHGHPCASVIWDEQTKWTKEGPVRFDDTVLQVGVARLLGYQWPAELDEKMELAAEQRELVQQAAQLNALADDDGIVCLPAVRGEKPAHIRLESMLIAAYEDDWSADTLHKLLSAVGSKDLETWLRDKFFEQHCKLFQHRPFIWQVWDGLKDGFSVLVNYHKLDYAGLERLIYTYLGDWIRIQEQGTKEGIDGAESRLIAARNLQKTLEAILAGEAPLDIFVRWKSLEEQPIGWNPDLNDGVRLNIRPFMSAPAVGKKDAGILRAKPNIHWKKDRGNDVESAAWYTLGLEYGETVGSRINDHHLTLAEKREAREKVTKEGS